MRYFLPVLALPSLLAMTCASASGRVVPDDELCRGGQYPQDNQPPGVGVAGPGGATAYDDQIVCHTAGPRCQSHRVPPGGHLVLGRHRDGFICAYFPNGHDTVIGWVKADDVRPQRFNQNPPVRAWLGLWLWNGNPEGDPYIRFRLHKGALMVQGASWTTGPEEHVGRLDEKVRPTGYRAFDAECNTTFWLIGRFLVVADDHYSCFAPGADFDGVYVRATRRKN